ncbi:MAG: molybdopterin-synthase adenylyltransferase MoeB [Acidobacteriota bacterium]
MSVHVRIPTPLRGCTEENAVVEASGANVGAVLEAAFVRYPALRERVLDGEGHVHQFVNLFVNGDDVRFDGGLGALVSDGDELTIVPAIAGGSTGFPTLAAESELTHDEILRYSRHVILPEVTMAGQRRLKGGRVLLIGVGGLGSPAALYLAAAGVGKLGLVDFDTVDATNLQRQILHDTHAVGHSKLDSAVARLSALNPCIDIETYEEPFTSDNALDILAHYDVVLDGTDNFPTRYLTNDAAYLAGKPNVYGSIFRFEGQASVFWPDRGPCYRCLYPSPPPPGMVPSCAEGGVLGVLPGVIGCLQATEVIKILLGVGKPLVGRLLTYDALQMRFGMLTLRQDPACPLCGPSATIDHLEDLVLSCDVPVNADEADDAIVDIEPAAVVQRLAAGESLKILDVREEHEAEICRIDSARLIPLRSLEAHLADLDPTVTYVVHCKSGKRSRQAIDQLRAAGFAHLYNLRGGILAWADQVDPTLARY